jgi:hypothetical protein
MESDIQKNKSKIKLTQTTLSLSAANLAISNMLTAASCGSVSFRCLLLEHVLLPQKKHPPGASACLISAL